MERQDAKKRLIGLLNDADGLEGTISWDGERAVIDMIGWNGLEIHKEAQRLADIWLAGEPATTLEFSFNPDADSLEFRTDKEGCDDARDATEVRRRHPFE